jgi:hypothetical protein
MNELDLALEKMPITFSSNKFSKKCQQLGLNKELIPSGVLNRYLHKNCEQLGSRRTWMKKPILNNTRQLTINTSNSSINTNNSSTNEQQAIELLKSLGYRITKQVIEWQEV